MTTISNVAWISAEKSGVRIVWADGSVTCGPWSETDPPGYSYTHDLLAWIAEGNTIADPPDQE